MASSPHLDSVLVVLFYVYPATVFFYFLFSSLIVTCTLQALKTSESSQTARPSRRAVTVILGFFLFTYLGQLAVIGARSVVEKQWPTEEHVVINTLSCILVFGLLVGRLYESEDIVWYPFRGSYTIALAYELLISILTAVRSSHFEVDKFGIASLILLGLRLSSLVILVSWTCMATWVGNETPVLDQESESLLPKVDGDGPGTKDGANNGTGTGYGSTTQSNQSSGNNTPEYNWERREREARESMEKRLKEGGNWFEYAKGFMVCSQDPLQKTNPRCSD